MIKKLLAISAFSLISCSALLGGCSVGNSFARYSRSYTSFGTIAGLVLEGEFQTDEQRQDAKDVGAGVLEILTDIEGVFSTSVASSDVCRFNAAAAGETVEISERAYTVLSLALDMYEETGGSYNAGLYYSVDLYGFAVRADKEEMPYDRQDFSKQLPDERYVQAFKELSASFKDIRLYSEGGSYYAVKPQAVVEVEGRQYSLAIDLGGIAKGYAVDIVDKYIEEKGYTRSNFSYGMSSVALNRTYASESGEWYVTYRDPRGDVDDYYMAVNAADTALSTSGDYENYYEIEGVRYCHIIDPATGSPIQNGMVAACCMGGTAAEDDARTTAIMAMGLDGALKYINSSAVKEQGLKISFIYQNSAGEYLLITNIPEGEYELLNENYKLASRIEGGNVVFDGVR